MLHGQLIGLKKMETVAANRNSEEVKLARREYAEWLVQAHGHNEEIIFIDESGFNLWLARTRGRARVGQRAVRIVAGPIFPCIMAISTTRGIYSSFGISQWKYTCRPLQCFPRGNG